jgi:hypothetical protein
VLDAVQRVITAHGTSTVTTVGQSFGAALALLESVFLRLQVPTAISVKFVGYGLPRVENQAWANFVDVWLPGNVTHINNKPDPVPVICQRPSGTTARVGRSTSKSLETESCVLAKITCPHTASSAQYPMSFWATS